MLTFVRLLAVFFVLIGTGVNAETALPRLPVFQPVLGSGGLTFAASPNGLHDFAFYLTSASDLGPTNICFTCGSDPRQGCFGERVVNIRKGLFGQMVNEGIFDVSKKFCSLTVFKRDPKQNSFTNLTIRPFLAVTSGAVVESSLPAPKLAQVRYETTPHLGDSLSSLSTGYFRLYADGLSAGVRYALLVDGVPYQFSNPSTFRTNVVSSSATIVNSASFGYLDFRGVALPPGEYEFQLAEHLPLSAPVASAADFFPRQVRPFRLARLKTLIMNSPSPIVAACRGRANFGQPRPQPQCVAVRGVTLGVKQVDLCSNDASAYCQTEFSDSRVATVNIQSKMAGFVVRDPSCTQPFGSEFVCLGDYSK